MTPRCHAPLHAVGTLRECRTPLCSLAYVTLEADALAALTPVDVEAWRQTNAAIAARKARHYAQPVYA